MAPSEPFDARAWAAGVRDLVRKTDATAELCLAGDEWVVEVAESPTRSLMTVRVVRVD